MQTAPLSYSNEHEIEIHCQVGASLYPDFPAKSLSEQFYQLKKSMGIHASPLHSFDITADMFKSTHFLYSIDLEKILQASYSGKNTRAGDQVVIKTKWANGTPANATAATPSKLFIMLNTDNILEISAGAVSTFD